MELFFTLLHSRHKEVSYEIRIDIGVSHGSFFQKEPHQRQLYFDLLQRFQKKQEHLLLKNLLQEELVFQKKREFSSLPLNVIHVSKKNSFAILNELFTQDKLFYEGKKLKSLNEQADFCYKVQAHGGEIAVSSWVFLEKEKFPLTSDLHIFFGQQPFIIKGGEVNFFKRQIFKKWFDLVPEQTQFSSKKWNRICEDLEFEDEKHVPKLIKEKEKKLTPHPCLQLSDETGCFFTLYMEYAGYGSFEYNEHQSGVDFRNWQEEKSFEKDLFELGFIRKIEKNSQYYIPRDKSYEALSFLLEMGWNILDAQQRNVLNQSNCVTKATSTERYIQIEGSVTFGKEVLGVEEIIPGLHKKALFHPISKSSVALLDHDALGRALGGLQSVFLSEGKIECRKEDVAAVMPLLNSEVCEVDQPLTDFLKGFVKIRDSVSPEYLENFKGELFEYQKKGVDWLHFLKKHALNGMLCDEMGLGKTVQTLAFFSHLKTNLPILIIFPTSLGFNWKKEIEAFLPTRDIYQHIGIDRCTDLEYLNNQDFILCSYAIFRRDIEVFEKVQFECVVLDEAHMIKNPKTQIAQAIYRLQSNMRLSITGTPIENRKEELFSQFNFLMPSLMKKIGKKLAENFSAHKTIFEPFIMRRLKSDVDIELPKKYHQIIHLEFDAEEKKYYEEFLQMGKKGLLKKIDTESEGTSRLAVFEMILRLRQLCNHQSLIDKTSKESLELSTKLKSILLDIQEIVSSGKKVICYSQFTSMLTLIKNQLINQRISFAYLDGKTKDRESQVSDFQEGDAQVFLISLKAGGVGLNLTKGDFVLLVDPWWNESVENQAIDRTHRIGRESPVIIRRYIVKDTIEDKMMELKAKKQEMAIDALDFESSTLGGSLHDLLALLD